MFKKEINLFGVTSLERWFIIRNEGNAPIKRARAWAKFAVLGVNLPPPERPKGISDENYASLRGGYEGHAELLKESYEKMFAVTYPFYRSPHGTAPLLWSRQEGMNLFETDIPVNDEVGVQVAGIYSITNRFRASAQLKEAGIVSGEAVIFQMGKVVGTIGSPLLASDATYLDLAVKFWIIGENVVKDTSEIFRIQIPMSFDAINCRPISKRERKDFEKIFAKSLS
jgi:hypothetical protein